MTPSLQLYYVHAQGVIETAPGMPEPKSEEAEEESKIIR
jgi:hypothetical protein